MADLSYDVRVNTQQANAALAKMQNQVEQLSGRMGSLNKSSAMIAGSLRAMAAAVVGVGLTTFIDDLQSMENKIRLASKSSDEFNVSMAYVKAIADQTGQSLTAVGSLYGKVAANAEKLGYSQEQVATTTSAFAMALKASGASAQGSASSIYQFTQILAKGKVNGDEFTTIMENLGGPVLELVASKLGTTTAGLLRMKEEGTLTAAMFTDGLIKAYGDLSRMSDRMTPTIGMGMERIKTAFADMIIKIDQSSGIFSKIGALLEFVAQNARGVSIALAVVAGAWAATKIVSWGVMAVSAAAGIYELVKAIRLIGVTAAVAEALATGGLSAIAAIAGAAVVGVAASKAFDEVSKSSTNFKINMAEVGKVAQEQMGNTRRETELTAKEMKKLSDETYAITSSLSETLKGYAQNNAEKIKGIQLDRESLGLTETQKAVKAAAFDAEKNYISEMTRLQQQYDDIKATGSANEKQQLPAIATAMKQLTEERNRHLAVLSAETVAYQQAQAARQLQLYSISEEIRSQNELQRIQDDIAKMTMTEIEQKYYDIEAAARASAKAAIEAEEARRNAKLDPSEAQAYYDAAIKGSDRLKAATKSQFDMSRSWSTGWKKAMNEYVANATNAASRAQELFSKATKGMEDAIVGFAKTGKFEWKSFVADMLEQLLRSQIQQVFASMMGNMSNSMSGVTGGGGNLLGGLLGGVGSLFGSGSSGYMPGESSGMPTSSSNVFGDLLGGIGSGITSVFSGIGDLFGGFFANGGNLGAGKWGIAGERGPELISGPASVTPMSGGGVTNVTYNINATDAMSFKQLVAQDPGFIHAVVMQGAKSMPGTRR
jgi:lambda family phage tail tape measure protein